MTTHYEIDRSNLDEAIRKQTELCSGTLQLCHQAMTKSTEEVEKTIRVADAEMLALDNDIQERSVSILALHQPFAENLRHAVSSSKVSSELRRISELTCNVLERLESWESTNNGPVPEDIVKLQQAVQAVFGRAQDALRAHNSEIAESVHPLEDRVDLQHEEILSKLSRRMQEEPDMVPGLLHLFSCCRILERLADHAVNLCRVIVFHQTGTSATGQKSAHAG